MPTIVWIVKHPQDNNGVAVTQSSTTCEISWRLSSKGEPYEIMSSPAYIGEKVRKAHKAKAKEEFDQIIKGVQLQMSAR
jgi:hypothetical protein